MADFDSTPAGLALEGFISGVWQDLVPDTTEHSITITSAEPPFKPARLNVPLWRQSGGLAIPDFCPLRAWDPGNPAAAYPRYFQGFAINQQQGIVSNINQTYDLDAVGLDWLLSNPPQQLITKMPFGALPWLADHPHIVGDRCIRIATDGHMYEVTAATGDKMSGGTEPDFDTGTGAVTVDNDLEWTEIGSAYVTDVDVLTDLLPEYFGAEITFTSPNVLCADVGYFEIQPGMIPQDAIKSLAERVSEFAAVSFPTWVALTPYLRGAIVEPITSNGYGYLNIKDGTSSNNANIFNGHTTIGEEFDDGSTRWVTFIQTNIAPTWQIVTPLDNAAHTNPWTGNFVWYDANNSTHVPTLSIEYSDQEVEDATHKHLSSIVIHRNGSSGYANEVHVFGRNGAYGFAEDLVAQGFVQRVITAVYFMTGENDPDTNAALDIVANRLLGRWVVRETLTLESDTPLSTVVMQGGLRFGKVTMALLGLSAQAYPMTRVTMKMSENEGSKWSYEWGDPFRGDLDQIGTLGGTRRYPGDHTPPALVTFPADWVLQNLPEGDGTVTLVLKWQSGNEADLEYYKPRLRLSTEIFDRVLPDVMHPRQHITIPGIPEGVDITLKIIAFDTSRNPKPPVTEANWAVSPTITAGTYVAEPPTALLIDTAQGAAGYDFATETTARPYLKWTPPATLPLYYLLTVGKTADPTTNVTLRILSSAVDVLWPYPLIADGGTGYTASIVSFAGGHNSSAATLTFTPPAWTLSAAPVISDITHGMSHGEYYANVELTHAGDHSGGGNLKADPVGSGPDTMRDLPGVWTSPRTFTLKGLTVNQTYDFTAYVLDSLNRPSDVSVAVTYRIVPLPSPDPPEWDEEPPDSDDRGQEILTDNGVTRSWETDPTHLFAGLTTRKLHIGIGSDGDELGLPFSVRPLERGTLIITRKGSETGAGPFVGVPMASAHLRWYDETYNLTGDANYGDPDSHIQEDEIFDDPLPADFDDGFVEYQWEAPALARMGRVRIGARETTGIGDGEWDVWFAFASPPIKREVTGKEFAPVIDLTTEINVSSGAIVAGNGKVTVDADGIKVGNSSGAENIDFYNEAGTQVGSLWSGGPSGSGSINLAAFYNGAGSTDLSISSVDSLTLSESTHSEQIAMDFLGIGINPGAATRRTFFNQGSVVVGAGNLATTAVNGFLYISTSAGAPTGVPTTQLDTVPIHWDSTNHRLYAYSGGSWRQANATSFVSQAKWGLD